MHRWKLFGKQTATYEMMAECLVTRIDRREYQTENGYLPGNEKHGVSPTVNGEIRTCTNPYVSYKQGNKMQRVRIGRSNPAVT